VIRKLIAHFENVLENERKMADACIKTAREVGTPIRGKEDIFDIIFHEGETVQVRNFALLRSTFSF
jgi:hypothetical protein